MNLIGKSVTELRNLIKSKKVSKGEVWDFFVKRVEKYNKKLNAFLTIGEIKNLDNDGELAGVPVAIKDNFCTKGLRTTASSKVLDNFIPPYSATVVKKLEGAGSVILGKTNMDAWAHGSSTETSAYGSSKNPWDLSRTPGGSSGGSAVAVSAYLSPYAIGSETAGSIKQPAAWSGVIGLKPTYGRVSRYGLISMASSTDCPGPLTVSVEDAALILKVLAGKDEFDATTSQVEVKDYPKLMKEKRKFTIGISDEFLAGVDEDIKKAFFKVKSDLEKMGHRFKKVSLLSPEYSISVYTILQRAEVASNLSRFDGVRYGNTREFFGEEAKRRVMLGNYVLSYGYYDAYYKKAQKVRTLIVDDFKRAFKDVDLILTPTTPMTALKLGEWEKYPFFGEKMDVLNEPIAIAGLPAIDFPVGLDRKGLPIGLQLTGNYFKEDEVLNAAYQLEKETEFYQVIKKGFKKWR